MTPNVTIPSRSRSAERECDANTVIWKLRQKVRKVTPTAVRIWFLYRVSSPRFSQGSIEDELSCSGRTQDSPCHSYLSSWAGAKWGQPTSRVAELTIATSCHTSPAPVGGTELACEKAPPLIVSGPFSISWAHSQSRRDSFQAASISWIYPCGFFLPEFGTRPSTFMIPRRIPLPPCNWEPICACAKSLQSCPTLYDPMDCSLPGSSALGIL